jgi:hypothetical protein
MILCIGHIPRMEYTQFGQPTTSLDHPSSLFLQVPTGEGCPLLLTMKENLGK